MYFEMLKVWGTSPDDDPNKIEWVRFSPESPLDGQFIQTFPATVPLLERREKHGTVRYPELHIFGT